MNVKRWALLLALIVLLQLCLPVSAAETIQYLKNGGFESLLSSGVPQSWILQSGAEIGKEVSVETEKVHGGAQAIKMATESGGVWLSQKIAGLRGATKYQLEAWTVIKKEGGKGAVKIEFSKVADGITENMGSATFPVEGESRNWTQKTFDFTTPEGATNARVYLRILNGGEYYWDDVSIYGEAPPDGEPIPCKNLLTMMSVNSELIKNSGFETLNTSGGPANWTPISGQWVDNSNIALDDQISYSGQYSVKITTATGGNPWVRQRIPVTPCTKYQASVWVRKDQVADVTQGAIRFKYEAYSKDETYISRDTVSQGLVPENDRQWVQFRQDYTAPDGCYFLDLYLRLHSTGTIWFDDMSFYQVEAAPAISLTTDSVFYYPDQKKGIATAKLYDKRGAQVDFELLDGNDVLYEQKATEFFEDAACFEFNTSYMTKKKHEYTIRAIVKDSEGNDLQTQTTDVYKYDRPKNVDKDCNYLNEDGSLFIPTIGYHVPTEWYKNCADAGINVVQIPYGYAYIYPEKPETLLTVMSNLEKYNLKGIICLYYGMLPASHPANLPSTIKVVQDFKDNPNVFGYAVMDEPYAGIANAYEDAPYYLKEAYKVIREYDDKHPVYCLEASVDLFTETAKYCDVLTYDPYPSNQHEPATHVRNSTEMAVQATRRIKPTYAVFQAFLWRDYFPNITEIRSFWYQALLADSHGEGYFCVENSYGSLDINETELWPGITEFAANEQDFVYDVFGYGTYPVFNFDLNTEYEYKSVLKDDMVYLVVLNRSNEEKTAEISLLSRNRYVQLEGNDVTPLYGCSTGEAVKDGNTLKVKLSPRQVSVYKIDAQSVTEEALSVSRFEDLEGFSWAENAINTLYKNGIVNGIGEHEYEPGQPITRADFAMYLVNTLRLSARKYDIANSFADVDAGAAYARAIAIGKAIGIFAGNGENFMPQENISRQDAMVMCTRALRYIKRIGGAGSLKDLEGFSDWNTISDYASLAVANMVKSSIIQGNSDGTINPFGNTTRAEAAVIMAKILAIVEGL